MIETKTRLKIIAALSLLATPSYLLCFVWHICMTGGHIRYAFYPLYQLISDFWWMVCFVTIFMLSFCLCAKRRIWFLYGSILLILFRIPLGSVDGGSIILELPLLVIMDVFAIEYLFKPEKYIISGEAINLAGGKVAADFLRYVKKSMIRPIKIFLVVFIVWWVISFTLYVSSEKGAILCLYLNIPASGMLNDPLHLPYNSDTFWKFSIPITIMATIYAIAVVCVIQGIRKLYSMIQNKKKSQ